MSEASPLGLAVRAHPHQRVGWFELFYDLVMVAAVGQSSHLFSAQPTWSTGSWIAGAVLILFSLWLLTTLNHDLCPGDDGTRRALVLVQMLAVVVGALAMGRGDGLPDPAGFAALAVAFGSISLMYALSVRRNPVHRASAVLIAWSTGLGAVVLLAGTAVPEPAIGWSFNPAPLILAVGALVAMTPTVTVVLGRVAREGHLDEEHMGERIGQLVIIVLGESFVSLISTLGHEATIPNPFFFGLTFAVVYAVWTIYFSSVLPAGVPDGAGRLRGWLAGHWLLMFGAISTAAGLSALTLVPFGTLDTGAVGRWSPLPMLYVMLALAALTWLSDGRLTPLVRLHLWACAALLALTVAGAVLLGAEGRWATAAGGLLIVADAIGSYAIVRRDPRANGGPGA